MTDKLKSLTLHLAAQSVIPLTASSTERTITGLAVPYGPVGNSSVGPITFSQGSLTYSAIGRVKLLKQHDPERVLGFATELRDTPEGLYATFSVPESPEGDAALAEASDGRRDGLSVGVLLSEDTLNALMDKWIEGDNSPTDAAGELLEISQVSIPAFRDSRIDGSAAAALSGHVTLSVDFGGATEVQMASPTQENEMTVETPVSATATAGAETATSTPGPAPAALAGHAVIASEAPIYTFDGNGPSFVRDAFNARMMGNFEAADRLAKFNAMLGDNVNQIRVLTAAVETRATAPNYQNDGYRPDLLVAAIDKGRPIISRLNVVPLVDATPFRIPVDGTFTGVGDHTEGTSHVAEGDMTIGDVTITPGAVSGAYRISRELVDASNPALDGVALRAMLRDYRKQTEIKAVAALSAADGVATLNIDKVLELRGELNTFYDVMDEPADFVVMNSSLYTTFLSDVDGSGRPFLASVNPQNTVGTTAGFTGSYVDGVELVKSANVAANHGFIVKGDDFLVGESAVQTFRYDEVEGPGVVKLALFAYFVAKALRATSVQQITSAAA